MLISTNTIEGCFSILKCGINGIYHHAGKQHLHRYLSEFDFRYNSRHVKDGERWLLAIRRVAGKRLTYRYSRRASALKNRPRIIAARDDIWRELRRRQKPFTAWISTEGRMTQVSIHDGTQWKSISIAKQNLSPYHGQKGQTFPGSA